jgi:AraC-like DNA-binding protein
MQVDAALIDDAVLLHCDDLDQLASVLAADRAAAALLSAALARPATADALAALVRRFPGVVAVGLITEAVGSQAALGNLLLRRAAVATVVDARVPDGWSALRTALARQHLPDAFLRAAITTVVDDLRAPAGRVHEGAVRFVRTLFSPGGWSVAELAERLGTPAATLTLRFHEAGLPSAQTYVRQARLAWAAHLAEASGATAATVALRLDAAHPQQLATAIKRETGLTATKFFAAYNGAAALDRFRARLIAPYRDVLRTFDPRGPAPRHGPGGRSVREPRSVKYRGRRRPGPAELRSCTPPLWYDAESRRQCPCEKPVAPSARSAVVTHSMVCDSCSSTASLGGRTTKARSKLLMKRW